MEEIYNKLRVTEVIGETSRARSFVLEPVGWNPVYKAGQFVTLAFRTSHGEKRRSYSISSDPSTEPLTITIKKIDNGEFSRPLTSLVKQGDILYCSGIAGFFTLPETPDTELFFLAAGIGITPCFSLIKSALKNTASRITLVYSNRNQSDTVFYTQLMQLQSDHRERFTVRFLFSDHSDIYHKRLSRWLLDQLLDEYVHGRLSKVLFYVCGPFDYMQTVKITLLTRVPRENIRTENYDSSPRLIMPAPPDTRAHKVSITMGDSVFEVMVKYPESLLATAKKAGIVLPYSCEAGRCGSCVASCTKGEMWMAYNEVLTDTEVQKGRILTCQSFPINGDAAVVVGG